jgi:hypothetical protein
MKLRTCVAPSGRFVYGIHKPHFQVANLRQNKYIASLGSLPDGRQVENRDNFPDGAVREPAADWIYEIPNAFPFRGATFILKHNADAIAANPKAIRLPQQSTVSLSREINQRHKNHEIMPGEISTVLKTLPEPMLIALAATSTDPQDLIPLADLSADFVYDSKGKKPTGILYAKDYQDRVKPSIKNQILFQTLANNKFLPDAYKDVMALRPGAQGKSEIVGEWYNQDNSSHVFEYFRQNSYIPWGHYAANMANDSVRYQIGDLTGDDMSGMRHLYYQRSYLRLAEELGLLQSIPKKALTVSELEDLRHRINEKLSSDGKTAMLRFNSTLWGWNFGFDFAPSGYRLHASHQQIHQQYALVPSAMTTGHDNSQARRDALPFSAFSCGDLISGFSEDYRQRTGKNFFETYIRAIQSNDRLDSSQKGERSLVVYADEHVMVFVPKAQTSQWELQVMTLKPMGNILETDMITRQSLDHAMLISIRILASLGAKLLTTIEYSKRFDSTDTDQRLLYAFLPKLPQSPGAFSETQLRWINNHYPEDFAAACRARLPGVLRDLEI